MEGPPARSPAAGAGHLRGVEPNPPGGGRPGGAERRVLSDGGRSFANTCSLPRRPVARTSARFASWCAPPWERRSSSPRWVRPPSRIRLCGPSRPPPLRGTRTADPSVVVGRRAGRSWPPRARRSAPRHRLAARARGRRSPDHSRPAGARSGRTGRAGRGGELPRMRAALARLARVNEDEPPRWDGSYEETGGDLLSQALASQVPSALWGLTALFGMGRGVSPTQ